jgi:glycerol-3-phosphate dehydrogenase
MTVMKRNIAALTAREYDLVVVGGGFFGICAAWDAALRGLSVAILEKRDFSHATSANHFKMVHGGIRYLQHGDIIRIRESSRERSALLRIAPHLVQPLPIVIPTYGHGTKGKEILGLGMLVYDILTLDRNQGIQKERQIPQGRFLSRREVLRRFPGIKSDGLTGGALFYDGQFYNPPRLAISVLRSAAEEGAEVANYIEVDGFLRKGNRIFGVKATDALTGDQLEVRAKMVLNAAGPWAHRLLDKFLHIELESKPTFSRDLAFVVRSKTRDNFGLAFLTETKDADTIFDRGGRHLFAVPWKGYTLIGVWPLVFSGPPEDITVTEDELQEFISETNEAYPGLSLSLIDILMINTGLTLHGGEAQQIQHTVSYGHRSILVDHSRNEGLEGLVTLIGVRATTARGMAEKTINMVMRKLGKKSSKCKTFATPVYGGDIDSFNDFRITVRRELFPDLTDELISALIHNYGSKYPEVLKYTTENSEWAAPIGDYPVLKAEIIHALREEMALKLSDVLFRRTDLGTAGYPGDDVVLTCADIMASELNWDRVRKESEILEAKTVLPQFC